DVERAWMDSPSHRANILNEHFTEIGIATAEGVYQGRQTTFVVQMFGAPSRSASFATVTSGFVPAGTENGTVGGETIETVTEENSESAPAEDATVLFEDETFIAVKTAAPAAPSAGTVAFQSTFVERLLASPQTLLSYLYAALAGIVGVALILLVVVEARVQRPKNVAFGLLLLLVMGTLFYFSYADVVVAGTEPLALPPLNGLRE
ncbi:MAG: CAP domain-containing protein, partial [Candidatus Paceibacteria bacterium]